MRTLVIETLAVVTALLAVFVLPPGGVFAQDVYYFHDSGSNGVWDNQWNPEAGQHCPFPGEYMDCTPPTGSECLSTPVKGGLSGGPLSWLDLPGCGAGTYPPGNWTANLWLVTNEPDSIVVTIWVVPCNDLCPETPIWISWVKVFVGAAATECTLRPITVWAPAFSVTDSDRLMLEIYSDKWGSTGQQTTWLCWNAATCASNLTTPANVFCNPVATEPSTWGAIKTLYR